MVKYNILKMENFITKQEGKLYKALQNLLHNSVDKMGIPKRATVKQLTKAQKALLEYDEYERKKNGRL